MRTALAAVWATILCAFFVQTANALQTDLISLKADSVFASGVIGLMMATYYLGYVMGPLIGRVVIGRIGHINTVLVTMLLPAAVILVQPLFITAPAWALFRALSGFALAISYVAVESWIHESVGNGLRGRVFSLYMFSQLVGMTLAQGLLTFGTADTYYMFVLAAALFLMAAIPILTARHTAPSGAPPKPLPLPTLFRLAPRGALVTLLAGLSWSIFFTFGPVYAKRVGFDMAGIGFLMAISVAAGGVMQMPAGWMSDRWGRKPVLLILFGGGVLASLIGIAFDGASAHLIAAALSGGFIFPIYAVAAALVNDGVKQEARVAAASGLVLLFGFGSIFGPLLCGLAMGAMGPSGFFAVVAATMICGLAVLLAAAPQGRARSSVFKTRRSNSSVKARAT